MNYPELRRATDAACKEFLTAAGFRRVRPGTWNRLRGDEQHVIELQRRTNGQSFCVNLGINYTFLPSQGPPLLDGDGMQAANCALKFRLTENDCTGDQWWPMEPASADAVAVLVRSAALPLFDLYKPDGPMAAIEISDVVSGNVSLLDSIGEVWACLILALLHERLGNPDKCVAAARAGVEFGGMAVNPRAALKAILRRHGQTV